MRRTAVSCVIMLEGRCAGLLRRRRSGALGTGLGACSLSCVAAVEADSVVEVEVMEAEREVAVDGEEDRAKGLACGTSSKLSVWEGIGEASFMMAWARCWAAWEKCRSGDAADDDVDGDELG